MTTEIINFLEERYKEEGCVPDLSVVLTVFYDADVDELYNALSVFCNNHDLNINDVIKMMFYDIRSMCQDVKL